MQTDQRDVYNNPLPDWAEPVNLKVWCYQTSTTEATTDEDTPTETWTVYVRTTDDEGERVQGLDFLSRVEVPVLSLQLNVQGNPHPWTHPRTGAVIMYELTGVTTDDGWVS